MHRKIKSPRDMEVSFAWYLSIWYVYVHILLPELILAAHVFNYYPKGSVFGRCPVNKMTVLLKLKHIGGGGSPHPFLLMINILKLPSIGLN